MTFLTAKKHRCGVQQGSARLRIEPLEDRRMMAVDLGTVVPNLNFEAYTNLPSDIDGMTTAGETVNNWREAIGTTDYYHSDSFMGMPTRPWVCPEPLNGSKGFIALISDTEYAVNQSSIAANTEYIFDLFAGAVGDDPEFDPGFDGELVVFGVEDLADVGNRSNYIELLSVDVDVSAEEWIALPNQKFTSTVALDAIIVGARMSSGVGYLLIDAAPVAPRVTQVTVSGPNALDGNHSPTDGGYDIPVGDGDQLRTVPVGGANTVSIAFSKDVTIASTDLSIIALNGVVTEPGVATFVEPSSLNNFTATWTFSSPLPAAQYLMSLADSVNASGIALDGEWTNPGELASTGSSIFPSGDGYAGGDFDFIFTVLPGDVNGDLLVNNWDLAITLANYDGTGKSWAQADFTGEGSVTNWDLALVLARYDANWTTIALLADFNSDYAVDDDDEIAFLAFYSTSNLSADLNGSGTVTSDDYDAFYDLFDFDIDLNIVV